MSSPGISVVASVAVAVGLAALVVLCALPGWPRISWGIGATTPLVEVSAELGQNPPPPAEAVAGDPLNRPGIAPLPTELAGPAASLPPVVPTDRAADAPVELPPGTPDARAVAVLLMLTPELAEAAVPVIEERLETEESVESGEPFAVTFPERSVTAVPGTPVVTVDLALAPGVRPHVLTRMFFDRDLGFLAWW